MISPPPLVCLLCVCSYSISSLHRQVKSKESRNTRGTNVGIAMDNISSPSKAANTKVSTAKGIQYYPKTHLPVSSLHSRATGISRKVFTVESNCPPPPFQPLSLSHPSFHHVRQKYIPLFHGYFQELFTIEDLRLQIQSSLKKYQESLR